MKNPYACAVCPESFSDARSLVNHVQNKHAPVKINKDTKVQNKLLHVQSIEELDENVLEVKTKVTRLSRFYNF